jgi:peptide/nickel transport system permease protein
VLGWRWFTARIGGALITLLGVTIVVFVVLRAIPGDTITASLGIESGTLTPEQKASLRHFYGIDQPWPVQLWTWLTGVLHGADSVTQGVALLGLAVPEFVLGTVVVAVLAEAFHYFPDTSTFVPLTRSVQGNLSQVMYPALVLAVAFAANVMRTTRSEYVEVAQADYVRTARGKGVHPGRIRGAHILRNATIPIVTLTGIQFGYLLGGTVIIEQIFALPGMGRLLFTSISSRDYPVVQATVLIIAALFVVVNLLVDLLYRVLDPRTRTA